MVETRTVVSFKRAEPTHRIFMPMAADPAANQQGVENIQQDGDPEPQRGRGSTRSSKLSAPLRLPKNRSTGNLAIVAEGPEKPRLRFSFDSGSGVAESDQITRYVFLKTVKPIYCMDPSPNPRTGI